MSDNTSTTTTTNETTKVTAFLDTVGRTIVGELVNSDDSFLKVKNPVVLHIVPQDEQGRMSVQLLPIFFREFLAEKTADVVFSYNKNNITETDIETFDFRLEAQYKQLFNKSNIFVPNSSGGVATPTSTANNPSVINLFDE